MFNRTTLLFFLIVPCAYGMDQQVALSPFEQMPTDVMRCIFTAINASRSWTKHERAYAMVVFGEVNRRCSRARRLLSEPEFPK